MALKSRVLLKSSVLTLLMSCGTECPEGSDVGDDGLCHLEDEDSESATSDDTATPDDTAKPEDTGNTSDPSDTSDTSDTGKGVEPVEGIASRLGLRDYGFAFWPETHWTNWGSYDDIQYFQTGYYGLALDISEWSFDHFGLIDAETAVDDALLQDNSVITDLPTASLSYSITDNGVSHAAEGLYSPEGGSTNPSQVIDMGRFMQRTEVPQVSYTDSSLGGSLQVASMPRHLVLTHRVDNNDEISNLDVHIALSGDAVTRYANTTWLDGTRAVSITDDDGNGWSFIIPEQDGLTGTIVRADDGSLAFTASQSGDALGEVSLSVIALPSNAVTETQRSVWLSPADQVTVQYAQKTRDGTAAEDLVAAEFDPERGVYLISLRDLSTVGAPESADWTDADNHNWYNRHRLVIENNSKETLSVPLAFDGGNNAAFYIVGGSPMLRDTSGEPTGVPLQISKNWHESPFWYHLYSTMELEPGSHEFEHTFAHSKWGEAYAAAHAQLSLIGWGTATHGDQQWDESSLGAFGESVTYDPDLTLSRSMIDDVRPFLVSDTETEWGWTGNVGGANFLVYEPTEGYSSLVDHQLSRTRTHYAYTGPNLTNVTYAGISRDGKIEARLTTQMGRTDDLIRVYYHLEYTFLEDVNYDRLVLFQVAADRYGDNAFTRYAYGDASGTLFDEAISAHATTGYAAESDRGITLSGDSPWVMLYASSRDSADSLYEHLGNVGYVIRSYEATIDGVTTTTPVINIVQTYNVGDSQMSFELGVPYDADDMVVPAGSVVRATVEYLVPPADKDAYYGESDYLDAMAAEDFNTTAMLQTLATGNHLEVATTVGTLERTWPVELEAAEGETAVQFTLTGGLGYTPVTIHGLPRPDGWQLEQLVEGAWERVDQSVEGNDYWQAYDNTAEGTFDLVFNLHNREPTEYRLVR